jgi:hypothetical protein
VHRVYPGNVDVDYFWWGAAMTKQEALERLSAIKTEVAQMDKYAGQAKHIRDISNKIQFLERYMALDNLPELFVKEVCQYAKTKETISCMPKQG